MKFRAWAVRATRTSTSRRPTGLAALEAEERPGRASSWRGDRMVLLDERRGAAARAAPAPRRGHRPDRRQRPRPARRLQPPRPHADAARDARRRGDALGVDGDGRVVRGPRRAGRPADHPRRDPRRGSAGSEVVHARGTGHPRRRRDAEIAKRWTLARDADVASSSSANDPG